MFLCNVLSFCAFLMFLTLLGGAAAGAAAFTIPNQRQAPNARLSATRLATRLAAAVDRYKAAAVKLAWETLEESSARPVLNLSQQHNDSPETLLQANENDSSNLPTETWDEQWKQETLPGLRNLDILADSDKDDGLALLDKCPQLLRLPPSLILETATWLVDKF